MGHLTRIANSVVQNLERGPVQTHISEVIQGEPAPSSPLALRGCHIHAVVSCCPTVISGWAQWSTVWGRHDGILLTAEHIVQETGPCQHSSWVWHWHSAAMSFRLSCAHGPPEPGLVLAVLAHCQLCSEVSTANSQLGSFPHVSLGGTRETQASYS